LADGGEVEVEFRHKTLYLPSQLFLGKIGVIESNVVGSARHAVRVGDAVDHGVGNIPDMDEIALEVFLEDHQVAVGDRHIDEVVHEEIEPHTWRHAKDGCQTK